MKSMYLSDPSEVFASSLQLRLFQHLRENKDPKRGTASDTSSREFMQKCPELILRVHTICFMTFCEFAVYLHLSYPCQTNRSICNDADSFKNMHTHTIDIYK